MSRALPLYAVLLPAAVGAVAVEQPELVFNLSGKACGEDFVYKAQALVFGPIPAAFTAVLAEVPPAGEETARRHFKAVYGELGRVNNVFSLYVAGSEIERFNSRGAGEPFEASGEFYTLLLRSLRYHEASGGVFDPSVKPLIDLYRRVRKGEAVSRDKILEARSLVGMAGVSFLPGCRILKRKAGLEVDLGGIAKGHGVERAVALLKGRGVRAGIVEIGGDLKVYGSKPDGSPWEIGITDPLRPSGLAAVLSVRPGRETAVVTSGDYQRSWSAGGRTFTHIIDPTAGRPLEYRGRGVTLAAGDAVAADALATACFVLPEKAAFDLAERQGVGLLFVSGRPDGSLDFRGNERMKENVLQMKAVER